MAELELQLMQGAGPRAQELDRMPVTQAMKGEGPKINAVLLRPPRQLSTHLAVPVAGELGIGLAGTVPEHIGRAEIAWHVGEHLDGAQNIEVDGAGPVALGAAADLGTEEPGSRWPRFARSHEWIAPGTCQLKEEFARDNPPPQFGKFDERARAYAVSSDGRFPRRSDLSEKLNAATEQALAE